ncbi:MAG: 16S rRNA (uracil(1498)-N(3))-methyltransferase [Deltaproteobacteria bacterium]|nr:16S rRNA (uracil(1498)-N(3))-methyltransferase [Deltaproteobacteria bacterium]
MSKMVLIAEAAAAQSDTLVRLSDEKLNHLRRVLRMDWDAPLLVADGAGRLLEGMLEECDGGGAIRLGAVRRTEPRPLPFELVIALPKNTTMDWVVEKAVECGVTRITPVVSCRCVVKPHQGDAAKYVRRWQAIMDGAIEQSEHLWRPSIAASVSWSEFLSVPDSAYTKSFAFISELRAVVKSEAEALTETWKALERSRNHAVRLMLGPEGGFADQERSELVEHGFIPLSLGTAVLRVETAVVAALTLARVIRAVSST